MHREPLSRRSFLALSAMAVAQTALRPAFGQSQDFAHSTLKEASELDHRKTVVIVDDHEIVRVGVRRLLEREPDLKVIGEGSDRAEAVKLALQLKPDILLLNIAIPNQNGLEALQELNIPANATPVRVIMFTVCDDKNCISTAFKLGARGYVVKTDATQVLLKAIRTVMAGEYWLLREPVLNLEPDLRTVMQSIRQKRFGLTHRQLEIVSAVVAGYSNKEIAEYFKISKDTVKLHPSNIYDKVGVSTRLDLALFAVNKSLPIVPIG